MEVDVYKWMQLFSRSFRPHWIYEGNIVYNLLFRSQVYAEKCVMRFQLIKFLCRIRIWLFFISINSRADYTGFCICFLNVKLSFWLFSIAVDKKQMLPEICGSLITNGFLLCKLLNLIVSCCSLKTLTAELESVSVDDKNLQPKKEMWPFRPGSACCMQQSADDDDKWRRLWLTDQ